MSEHAERPAAEDPPAASAARPLRQAAVPPAYLTLFCLLYAIQGVVFAYFVTFNPGYLSAAGVSEEATALVQGMVLLPFSFKFLAAPISDRFNLLGFGHRRPYIVIGLALQGGGLVALGWIDPSAAFWLFTGVAFLVVTGLALYDTCTDGLVVDITPPADRPRVQGLLGFSRFFTAAVFTQGFGLWLERTGTGPRFGYGVLWACAGASLVPLAMGLALREPKRRAAEAEAFDWRALGVLLRPTSIALLLFGTFYAVVSWGIEGNLPIFYKERLGYSEDAIGFFGAARIFGRAVGFLILPIGSVWLGRRWTLRVAVLGLAVTEASQALVGPEAAWSAGLLALALGIAIGWTEGLFYVMAMEASDPRMAASTYALFMAVTNLSVMGTPLFYQVVRGFDDRFPPAFLVAGAATCLAFLLIRPLAKLKEAGAAGSDPGGRPVS